MTAALDDVDAFDDDVRESNAASVDDRGPGDEEPPIYPTPKDAVVCLGVAGAITLAMTYGAYCGVSWLVAVFT